MGYTWTTYPLSNETNFETKARAALEQWRSNVADIEAKLGDIQSGLINAADVTIPTGKTLDVSDGTIIGVSDVDATLSGTPKIFTIQDSNGTPYYFKAYPTRS